MLRKLGLTNHPLKTSTAQKLKFCSSDSICALQCTAQPKSCQHSTASGSDKQIHLHHFTLCILSPARLHGQHQQAHPLARHRPVSSIQVLPRLIG